jgi:hypothetical protein
MASPTGKLCLDARTVKGPPPIGTRATVVLVVKYTVVASTAICAGSSTPETSGGGPASAMPEELPVELEELPLVELVLDAPAALLDDAWIDDAAEPPPPPVPLGLAPPLQPASKSPRPKVHSRRILRQ